MNNIAHCSLLIAHCSLLIELLSSRRAMLLQVRRVKIHQVL